MRVISSTDLRLTVGEVCARVADAGQPAFRELSILRRLLRWIVDHETQPLNASAVAGSLGVDGSTVRRYVQRLVDAGVVIEVPAWRPGVMTRERKRSGYYFDDRTRIAVKLDTKELTPGGVARSLAPYGDIVNYSQGVDVSADFVFIPAQSTSKEQGNVSGSKLAVPLPSALQELTQATTPVAILIVNLDSDTPEALSALAAARNQASRIGSFFYRTSSRVAVLAALPADFSHAETAESTKSAGRTQARDRLVARAVSQTGRYLSLLLHQPTSELVPDQLTTRPLT